MLEWVALWRACMDSLLAWVACLRGWRACVGGVLAQVAWVACQLGLHVISIVTVIIEILP